MIRVERLTKKYGSTIAVHDLDFDVTPGVVTGFLGPNGSGKSTTMRVILGLDRPTSGRATVNGREYPSITNPIREVGALLDAKAVDGGRTARHHLEALALANAIPRTRVDEVLGLTGIDKAADKRVGQFSLGMSQRLGIAGALLGNPGTLLFDEPVNGLDPEGIRWVRALFRSLADEGRTVLVSSHLMSEMALTADEIVVIGRGEFITRGTVDELTARGHGSVLVRAEKFATLRTALESRGAAVAETADHGLSVTGIGADEIGRIALTAGIALSELTPQRATLEEVFMDLTQSAVEYEGKTAP
mgnify:FL=1